MKYFLGFLASIALVILVVVLVIRGITGGNNTPEDQVNLTDYANTNAVVTLMTDGPINANQIHNAFEIVVGRSEARMEVFQGYERQIIQAKNYPNNDEGYANFLGALQLAGFTKGQIDEDSEKNDPRGTCATGQRYILTIQNGTSEIQRFWTTSCGGQGTFRGNIQQINQLFRAQIPDYSRLISNTNL